MGDNLSTVKQTLSTSDIGISFLFFCEIRIKPFLTNFTFVILLYQSYLLF
jgi:hypothetical protein